MNFSRTGLRLHFVGIGGIGMSGIAEVLFHRGYAVSGSDLRESDTTEKLAHLGIKISIGHEAQNVHGCGVVIISSAVSNENPEVIEARRLRIPVIPRAEMLGELMRGKTGISIAGSHGKTSTTSMLATVLSTANYDPTIVIGGKVDALGGNAKSGEGEFVVAEADESDGSFLHLPAVYGIVTNIDNDHLDFYESPAAIDRAFIDFVGKMPFYGLSLVCAEDSGVRRCLTHFFKPVKTYGFDPEFDYSASEIIDLPLGTRFAAFARKRTDEGLQTIRLGELELRVPGRHNVLNALATLGIALEIGVPFEKIKNGLLDYHGVKRRFEICWKSEKEKIVVVDDYGHHPTEILATLKAARTFWDGRIITVFQPHRYTRTRDSREGFLSAFMDADVVYVTDVYAAGETPIPGVDAESLVHEIMKTQRPNQEVVYAGSLESAMEKVRKDTRTGDLILTMGAGSITRMAQDLRKFLSEKYA